MKLKFGVAVMERPVIYDYLDYRAFLREMFLFRKQKDTYFSYRYFSRKAGFASPNFLKLVIDGQRNLTNESIAKIAKGFGLKNQEREFFENLVFMNQASAHEERNHYYKKMISAKGYTSIHKLDKANYEYFSKWYYPVIREVVMFGDRNHTPEQIAGLLDPAIMPKEAERAMKLLTELGLIRKDPNGRWEQCEKALTTGPEVASLIIANFHREMLRLATESLDRHSGETRDITALTLSIRHEQMPEIKRRIASLRKALLELACYHEGPDQVVQINIQMFPLTKEPVPFK